MHPAVNFIAFQLGWFACVSSAAIGRPWLGLSVVVSVLLLHLLVAARPRREAALLGLSLCCGLLFDSLLVSGGWVAYRTGQWLPWLAPYWIVAMWPLFATTLNISMRWLHGRQLLAALLGAVAGPLSYLAGERLGALDLAPGLAPVLALGVAWGLAMPLLITLAARFDGVRSGPVPQAIHSWAGRA